MIFNPRNLSDGERSAYALVRAIQEKDDAAGQLVCHEARTSVIYLPFVLRLATLVAELVSPADLEALLARSVEDEASGLMADRVEKVRRERAG